MVILKLKVVVEAQAVFDIIFDKESPGHPSNLISVKDVVYTRTNVPLCFISTLLSSESSTVTLAFSTSQTTFIRNVCDTFHHVLRPTLPIHKVVVPQHPDGKGGLWGDVDNS